MIHEKSKSAAYPAVPAVAASSEGDWLAWPRSAGLLGALIVVLYLPSLQAAAYAWLHNDNYSHGLLIFPLVAALLWLQRDRLRAVRPQPVWWGFPLLGFGLLIQTVSYVLQLRYIGFWSLVPTLWGLVLVLHGEEMWRLTRFPLGFVIFAGALPNTLLSLISLWVKNASTTGAASLMRWLGYVLSQNGNLLQIPGVSIEVADVCSGFNKLLALIAFAALYGYLFNISPGKRLLLALAAVPVALLANVIRIAALIAVATSGGTRALHLAHNPAELFVLLVAFGLFVGMGKLLGCKTIRFSL